MSILKDNEEVIELEEELKRLPKGSVVYKQISGHRYPYLQWHEGVKTKSRYLKASEVDSIEADLDRRRMLETRLEELKSLIPDSKGVSFEYNTWVITGDTLLKAVHTASKYRHRSCFSELQSFLYGEASMRVLVLYGLRRTGKSTMIMQAILAMNEEERSRTALILAQPHDSMADLLKDLRQLSRQGYTAVFIDEVTFIEDFVDSAMMLSDFFAAIGMKIVLSGTDSLSFWLAACDSLYDRMVAVHTTFIPFAEWSALLGCEGIDDYIAYGGTFVQGVETTDMRAVSQIESPFLDENSIRRYIDTAIAYNIQNSLEHYRDGSRFGALYPLYERGELTNVINRVIEDMNHRFARRTIDRRFVSSDLRSAAQLLRNNPDEQSQIFLDDHMDVEQVTERVRHVLQILEADERTIEIDDEALKDIQDYLEYLELIDYVEVRTLLASGRTRKENRIVFLQPGMRYCQAKTLIQSMELDEGVQSLSHDVRKHIIDMVLNDVRGRMLEDIVLVETQRALGEGCRVFKLTVEGDPRIGLRGGEYDMVVRSKDEDSISLFEVKHSSKCVPDQARHLMDEAKCRLVESKFGAIVDKTVLYQGPSISGGEVSYLNVGEYLRGLGAARTMTRGGLW